MQQGNGWVGEESGLNPRKGYFEFVDGKFELVAIPNQEETNRLLAELVKYNEERLLKMPKLVIEVDGTAFHKEGSRQAERDKLKNKIFGKYGLPYICFKTNGSNERKQLINALNVL